MARREVKTLFSYSEFPCQQILARSRHIDDGAGTASPCLPHSRPALKHTRRKLPTPLAIPTATLHMLTTTISTGDRNGELDVTTTNHAFEASVLDSLSGTAVSRSLTDPIVGQATEMWKAASATAGQAAVNQLFQTEADVVQFVTQCSHYNHIGVPSLYSSATWATDRLGFPDSYYVTTAKTAGWDTSEQTRSQLEAAIQAQFADAQVTAPVSYATTVNKQAVWKTKIVLQNNKELMRFALTYHAHLGNLPTPSKTGQPTLGLPDLRVIIAPIPEQLAGEQTLNGCQLHWHQGVGAPAAALRDLVGAIRRDLPNVPRSSWLFQLLEIASVEALQGTRPLRHKMVLCDPRACDIMTQLKNVRVTLSPTNTVQRHGEANLLAGLQQPTAMYFQVTYSADTDSQALSNRDRLKYSLGTSVMQPWFLVPEHMCSMVQRLTAKAAEALRSSTMIPEKIRQDAQVWLLNSVTGQPVTAEAVDVQNVMQILVSGRGTPLSALDDESVRAISRSRAGLRLLIPCCDARSLFFVVWGSIGGLMVPDLDYATGKVTFNVSSYLPGLPAPVPILDILTARLQQVAVARLSEASTMAEPLRAVEQLLRANRPAPEAYRAAVKQLLRTAHPVPAPKAPWQQPAPKTDLTAMLDIDFLMGDGFLASPEPTTNPNKRKYPTPAKAAEQDAAESSARATARRLTEQIQQAADAAEEEEEAGDLPDVAEADPTLP